MAEGMNVLSGVRWWRGAESLLVVAVAVVLSGANAVGFTKCSKEAKQSMSNMATNAIRSQLTGGLGRFNPFGGAT